MRPPALFLAVGFLLALPPSADDGAASIAAGGIVTIKREPRIAMAKEVLKISLTRVIVDYDFRNDSDQDIETLVAFPIAPYSWADYYEAHEEAFNELDSKRSESRIASFQLTVDGKRTPYQTTVKALLNGRDHSAQLRSMHIDPATFGHLSEGDGKGDFEGLTAEQRTGLRQASLLGQDQFPAPRWTVDLRYYWSQRFLAHQTVHIHHEYKPITGEQQSPPDFLPGAKRTHPDVDADETRATLNMLHSTCVPDAALRQMRDVISARPVRQEDLGSKQGIREYFRHVLVVDWVDFILTTANTWKQPIEDFTLVLDTKPYPSEHRMHPYFCGEGPLPAGSGLQTTFHATNFVPDRELRVGFFRY